jgi:hypothetical protein
MRKLFIVTAVAVCAVCVVPAVASAAKKFESTVAWTHVNKVESPDLPVLMGTVTSESPKCVKNRSVEVSGSGSVTKKTDEEGVFGVSSNEISEDLGDDMEASVLKRKFGPRKKRKVCLPASGAEFTIAEGSTSVSDFSYNEETNTFSGTMVSSEPLCVDSRELEIDRFDGVDFTPIGFTTSDSNGAFSFTHNEALEPGAYDAFGNAISSIDFEPSGDGSSLNCQAFDSNDVDIPGP